MLQRLCKVAPRLPEKVYGLFPVRVPPFSCSPFRLFLFFCSSVFCPFSPLLLFPFPPVFVLLFFCLLFFFPLAPVSFSTCFCSFVLLSSFPFSPVFVLLSFCLPFRFPPCPCSSVLPSPSPLSRTPRYLRGPVPPSSPFLSLQPYII